MCHLPCHRNLTNRLLLTLQNNQPCLIGQLLQIQDLRISISQLLRRHLRLSRPATASTLRHRHFLKFTLNLVRLPIRTLTSSSPLGVFLQDLALWLPRRYQI